MSGYNNKRKNSAIYCIFEIIYVIPYVIKYQLIKCYIKKNIHHVIGIKSPRMLTIYFLLRNIYMNSPTMQN